MIKNHCFLAKYQKWVKKIPLTFLFAILTFSSQNQASSEEIMTNSKIFNIPYIMPNSLEGDRKFLEDSLNKAQKRLNEFAVKNGWKEFITESFVDVAEVYTSKAQFDQRIIYLSDAPEDTKLPDTYSAALEKRILISVSPEIYKKNFPE